MDIAYLPSQNASWDFSCPQALPLGTQILCSDSQGNLVPSCRASLTPVYQENGHSLVPAPGHSFVYLKSCISPPPSNITDVYIVNQAMPVDISSQHSYEDKQQIAYQSVTYASPVLNVQNVQQVEQAPLPGALSQEIVTTDALSFSSSCDSTALTSFDSASLSSLDSLHLSQHMSASMEFSTSDSNPWDQAGNARKKASTENKQLRSTKKHDKIGELLEFLTEIFGDRYNNDIKASGDNVLRVDVKSVSGLDLIQEQLDTIETILDVVAVSTRASLKKNKQRKGISIYIKVRKADDVRKMQSVLRLTTSKNEKPIWVYKVLGAKA